MMFGVWQTSRLFSEPGIQPWAVSGSLSRLEAWATINIPRSGQKRLFFAKRNGSGNDWTDAHWTVVGFLYQDGIKAVRKDPERYERHRRAEVSPWKDDGRYAEPTEQDWQRKTVNVDSVGE